MQEKNKNKMYYLVASSLVVFSLQGCLSGMGGGVLNVAKGVGGDLLSGQYKNLNAYQTYKLVTKFMDDSTKKANKSIDEFLKIASEKNVVKRKNKARSYGKAQDMANENMGGNLGGTKIDEEIAVAIKKIDFTKLNSKEKKIFKNAMIMGWESFFYQGVATKGALHFSKQMSTNTTWELQNAVENGLSKKDFKALPTNVKNYVTNIKDFGEILQHFSTVDGFADLFAEIKKEAEIETNENTDKSFESYNSQSVATQTQNTQPESTKSSMFGGMGSLNPFGNK
ncbi:MAG: hypothetical protein HON94_15725 [Methylococcales bacterium]|nr:hypothetical protein [Methylococcales bacterium]